MNLRDVVFDLDGTLIDSAPSILASMQAAFDTMGVQPVRPLTQDLIGPPLHETVTALLPPGQTRHAAQLAALFKQHYDEIGYRESRAYAGVYAMLAELQRSACRLLIATNKRLQPTQRILEHLGWSGIFDEVHTLDSVTPPLHSKAEMLTALRPRLSTSAIYVGDRSEDAQSTVQAHIPFVLVAWGYASPEYLAQQHGMATTPSDLTRRILTMRTTHG